MMKKVSVIIPCYLGYYDGCAKEREKKFIRALNSIMIQDYQNIEIVIISDGCDITKKLTFDYMNKIHLSIINRFHKGLPSIDIVFHKVKKQKLFSGNVRNIGIKLSTGDIICYLDTDDMFGAGHIRNIVAPFLEDKKLQWVYFNDTIHKNKKAISLRDTRLEHNYIGISSIAHRRLFFASWRYCDGYGHDWKFVKRLMYFYKRHKKVLGCNYKVCHVPNQIDS